MKVYNNNNVSFGAIRLPRQENLSAKALKIVDGIHFDYNPAGNDYSSLVFNLPGHEAAVIKVLKEAKIPFAHVDDRALGSQETRNVLLDQIDVII